MAINPADFQNPEVPTNNREFYMLYVQHMNKMRESFKSIDDKIVEIMESQQEDRENMLSLFEKWDKWKECHDKDLLGNLKTLERHTEKIDQIEKKVNTWNLTNTLAAIGAFITALFMKSS